ncbi:MAG: gliding motility-associated protein GldE [Alistipes sp.]
MVSGSEVAFFSLTRTDIDSLESKRDTASRTVVALLDDVDRLLATILIVNNLVNICIVILTSNLIDAVFRFGGMYEFLFKTVVVTFLLLLFGEIMPKVFSQSNPIKVARTFSQPLRLFNWAVYPVAYVLMRMSNRIGRLAPKNAELSIEELADAVDLTQTASQKEHQMLSGIVSFVNTEVVEIMRPRVDITGIEWTASYEEVKRVIVDTGYSRIPVYDDDLDDIKGVLYVKDLLSHINNGDDFGWQQLLRKPYFVPEHKKIDDLLKDFQRQKIHLAIVVDEYGSTQGLVSLEDIMEEVVGEISDESDEEERLYVRIDEHTYIFDGKTHIGEFERALGFEEETFADVEGHAETLAGLMMELKSDLLRRGDRVTAHGVQMTVEKMEGHRADKIKVVVGDAL